MNARASYAALCMAAVLFATHAAHADDSRLDRRLLIHAGLGLGLFGKEHGKSTKGEDVGTKFPAEDMVTTWGFYGGVELALHRYFTLGAELGYARWNTEQRANPPDDGFSAKAGRNGQIDVLLRPKLRLSLLHDLELYVLPIGGFTYYLPSDDSGARANIGFDAKGGPGFAVGGALGASYFVTEHFGLTGEAGYLQRYFSGSFTLTDGVDRHFGRDFNMGQLQLRVGLVFAL
jgi:hypothetical protein